MRNKLGFKQLLIANLILLGVVAAYFAGGAKWSTAYAQQAGPSTVAVFSGTATTTNPTQVVAGVSGQSIHVQAITASAVTQSAIGIYDGNSTLILTVDVPAGGVIDLTPFLNNGSGGLAQGLTLPAGDALKVACPSGSICHLNVRYAAY